jgi:hypothetical protein
MSRAGPTSLAPTRKRQRNSACFSNKLWPHEDDQQLTSLVTSSSTPINWSQIARLFPNKAETQVIERWVKVLDPSLLKGSWTRHEDEVIRTFVVRNGTKSWARLSGLLPGRTGKQCRERWFNVLDPTIDHGAWTAAEDRLLIELHQQYGNHWTKIGEFIPRRSHNAIKNRWHSALSKRLQTETRAPTPVTSHPKVLLPSITLLTGQIAPKFGDLSSSTFGMGERLPRLTGDHSHPAAVLRNIATPTPRNSGFDIASINK